MPQRRSQAEAAAESEEAAADRYRFDRAAREALGPGVLDHRAAEAHQGNREDPGRDEQRSRQWRERRLGGKREAACGAHGAGGRGERRRRCPDGGERNDEPPRRQERAQRERVDELTGDDDGTRDERRPHPSLRKTHRVAPPRGERHAEHPGDERDLRGQHDRETRERHDEPACAAEIGPAAGRDTHASRPRA